MAYPIREIEGIDEDAASRLKHAGIRTSARLLEAAKDLKGRKRLADRTGISEQSLLEWANLADHMRIKGLGPDFAPLVRDAGVRTVRELKHRNAAKLAAAIAAANAKRRKPIRSLPSEKAVGRWIEQANAIDIKISY